MSWVIDAVGFAGIGLVCAGVFLQFGLPWALMVGGASVFGMAYLAGVRESHVSE